MPSLSSLPWPDEAPVLPVEPLRPVLQKLSSLALTHSEDVDLLSPLVDEDGEQTVQADPPPALRQLVEEFGGISLRGLVVLDLLTAERTDIGPYTMLGPETTYYPLLEGDDTSVILTIDEDGAPGAVYGIGEDLALTLASRTLAEFLSRFARALEETLDELDEETERRIQAGDTPADDQRDEAALALMHSHLLSVLWGEMPEAERRVVPIEPLADAEVDADSVPAGTIAIANLTSEDADDTIEVMNADVDADLEDCRIGWAHEGLIVAIIDEARESGD